MENLTTWQKGKLLKYKIKENDITHILTIIGRRVDGKKKHTEYTDMKYYMCGCGAYELLGFIDKLGCKCKQCSGFTKD